MTDDQRHRSALDWVTMQDDLLSWRERVIGASTAAYAAEGMLAFDRFFHEVFEPNDLIYLACFNERVSGYHLGREEAWLVRKPLRLRRDKQGRLHSAKGMCVQYRDGWGFFAWHGLLVPERLLLHPEQLTRADWLAERNPEVRLGMQERTGNDRFAELLGGTCIDRGAYGELIEVEFSDDPEGVAHFLHVRDFPSSQRHSYLRVPVSIRSANEAFILLLAV